jgi:hypothetical protein
MKKNEPYLSFFDNKSYSLFSLTAFFFPFLMAWFTANAEDANTRPKNLTFKSYFPVSNIDSLETLMLKTPKSSPKYIDLLLKYENSYLFMNNVRSKYIYEIIDQYKNVRDPERKAMCKYIIGWKVIPRYTTNQYVLINQALNYYKTTNDTLGIVNCYRVLILFNNNIFGNVKGSFNSSITFMREIKNYATNSSDIAVKYIYSIYSVDYPKY